MGGGEGRLLFACFWARAIRCQQRISGILSVNQQHTPAHTWKLREGFSSFTVSSTLSETHVLCEPASNRISFIGDSRHRGIDRRRWQKCKSLRRIFAWVGVRSLITAWLMMGDIKLAGSTWDQWHSAWWMTEIKIYKSKYGSGNWRELNWSETEMNLCSYGFWCFTLSCDYYSGKEKEHLSNRVWEQGTRSINLITFFLLEINTNMKQDCFPFIRNQQKHELRHDQNNQTSCFNRCWTKSASLLQLYVTFCFKANSRRLNM